MVKNPKISLEQIEKVQKKLQALPVKDTRKTKQEAITFLSKAFDEVLEKGYTLQDICTLLKEEKLEISLSTLKVYLLKAKKETKEKQVPKQKNNQQESENKSAPENKPTDFVRTDIPNNEL